MKLDTAKKTGTGPHWSIKSELAVQGNKRRSIYPSFSVTLSTRATPTGC